ncbi:hypothetical protein JMN32_06080 [Fulvivirga sp. 29W222]|uniref:Uncharacterized protein n=1 Tax=Fulvivirga marina TaxID=2494733 RepID=A0A937FWV8_9BACT|nr:hypothetical protein [Fulvivirga marina]MBL6445866.1 hypothetical protein [Fulvivirga marina]
MSVDFSSGRVLLFFVTSIELVEVSREKDFVKLIFIAIIIAVPFLEEIIRYGGMTNVW